MGSHFPVTTHSPWSLSTVALFLGLGLALSIVPCVVLISPLHGVEFLVSVMLLSEKKPPNSLGLWRLGRLWMGFGSLMTTLVFFQGRKGLRAGPGGA